MAGNMIKFMARDYHDNAKVPCSCSCSFSCCCCCCCCSSSFCCCCVLLLLLLLLLPPPALLTPPPPAPLTPPPHSAAKVVGICDGTATAEDPDGLDMAEVTQRYTSAHYTCVHPGLGAWRAVFSSWPHDDHYSESTIESHSVRFRPPWVLRLYAADQLAALAYCNKHAGNPTGSCNCALTRELSCCAAAQIGDGRPADRRLRPNQGAPSDTCSC